MKQQQQTGPASPHIEVAVLGACLLESSARDEAVSSLEADDFTLDSHQRIFRCIAKMYLASIHVDFNTVTNALTSTKELASIGGPSYLAFLTEGIPRNFNTEAYVRILIDKAALRELEKIHTEGVAQAQDDSEPASAIGERAVARIQRVIDGTQSKPMQSVNSLMQGDPEKMFEQMSATQGIKTGFGEFDKLTIGLQPGDLYIIAGRPSMGKSSMAYNAARHIAVTERKVAAVFTFEDGKDSTIRRMLSSATRVDHQKIRTGQLDPHERRLLLDCREELMAAPLYLDDESGLTASRIRSKLQKLKRTEGLDVVFVDQLSKVSWADVYERGLSVPQLIKQQTGAFKKMAMDLRIPVVLMNQIGRGALKNKDSRPTLADLKESGAIEEDADTVVLLHRPSYYDRHDQTLIGKGEMIVAKNKQGPTKIIECSYNENIVRWEDTEFSSAQDSFYGKGDWA